MCSQLDDVQFECGPYTALGSDCGQCVGAGGCGAEDQVAKVGVEEGGWRCEVGLLAAYRGDLCSLEHVVLSGSVAYTLKCSATRCKPSTGEF